MNGPLFALTTWTPLGERFSNVTHGGFARSDVRGRRLDENVGACRAYQVETPPGGFQMRMACETALALERIRGFSGVESAGVVEAAAQFAHADDG